MKKLPLALCLCALLPALASAGPCFNGRVGLYAAQTQMRYSLAEPGEGTFVVIRNWVLSVPGQGEQS